MLASPHLTTSYHITLYIMQRTTWLSWGSSISGPEKHTFCGQNSIQFTQFTLNLQTPKPLKPGTLAKQLGPLRFPRFPSDTLLPPGPVPSCEDLATQARGKSEDIRRSNIFDKSGTYLNNEEKTTNILKYNENQNIWESYSWNRNSIMQVKMEVWNGSFSPANQWRIQQIAVAGKNEPNGQRLSGFDMFWSSLIISQCFSSERHIPRFLSALRRWGCSFPNVR